MRSQVLALLGLFATSAIAQNRESHHRLHHLRGQVASNNKLAEAEQAPFVEARAAPSPKPGSKEGPKPGPGSGSSGPSPGPHLFLNDKTKEFAVNGKGIPEVNFDVGESYAGLMSIGDKKQKDASFFFWFFPSSNEENRKKKETTIWLNGGENGPFVWRPGTLKPVANPWSWHHLTNMVWVEQPVSVGYSQGKSTISNEDELAQQFMGFWKNFVQTFGMQGYKVYMVGESYAGYYSSYISSHFVNAKDPAYFDLGGLMVVDGVSFDNDVQTEVVAATFVEQNYDLFAFDDNSRAEMHRFAKTCGYDDYVKKYYTYPPSGPQPALLPWKHRLANGSLQYNDDCGTLWEAIYQRAHLDNPCFNTYNILDHCPVPFDPLTSDKPYFDREDVKRAVHAPLGKKWQECVDTSFATVDDLSNPPSYYELPNVIDKTRNVIFVQGGMDFIIPPNGVLLAVQNMTWGGKMGFQSRPTDPFYVPRWGLEQHADGDKFYGSDLPDRSGVLGTAHTERGFTVVVTAMAGHEGPQYAPTAALRQLEKLLGRVRSLSDTEPFTLPQLRNVPQDKKPLGKGTYPVPWLANH